ncbi:uncharacterized protein LOC114749250 [Neltuma alba]|uniref:uncharacterized protein LOC114749250 n=1 Tax=Neltuma alba TaxID=207710 RepID=UPI0010A4FA1F|nr:uncharacterized protein LOC114749250 [Prosopis alba]
MALSEEKRELLRVLLLWVSMAEAVQGLFFCICMSIMLRRQRVKHITYQMDFFAKRSYLTRMVSTSDVACFNLLRMNRATFDRLCYMLRDVGGLKPSKHMLIDEQVAIFLHILAHHVKNRVIQHNFGRSGETISRYFNLVLNGMMRLGNMLLKKPEPVPEDSNDDKWKWFKHCLGALDGTHVKMRVPSLDKARYRNRKGEITTNVLGVCSQDGYFIYVLPGWEGSAADGRVLRDAISRRNGLRVPQGQYYLVDAGYTNCEGFLAPYRGQRYHLSEWREGRHPRNAVWDEYVKEAAKFRNKSFSYYDELHDMFGKDRATGKDAQTCEDVLEELQDQNGLDNSMLDADPDADMDISHVNTSHPEDTSHVNNQNEHISSDASSGSKKQKRTRADRDDILLKGIETVARSFSEGLMEASDRLGMRLDRVEREKRLDGMKESLYGDLMKIEGLSHKERMAAYVKMISDESILIGFFAMSQEGKVDVIREIISP